MDNYKDIKEKEANKIFVIKDKFNDLPWTDKYRPYKLDDILHQNEIIKILKSTIETKNIPHLLFYGSSGTGKTSSILAFAYELFGPKNFKERVIELNASDERGINIVRTKIINFAKLAISNEDPSYPSPPFKLVILDEADAMTNEAQTALRKVMEESSGVTRFCFICNYINNIIDPIVSRCIKLRFKPIPPLDMTQRLKSIATNEKLKLSDDAYDEINYIAKGDARKSIMILQNLKYIDLSLKKVFNNKDVQTIVSQVSKNNMINIWNHIKSNNFDNIIELINILKNKSLPIDSIIYELNLLTVNDDTLNDKQKSLIALHILNINKRLNDRANEFLQLCSLITYINGVINNNINYTTSNFI